jgi:hypothetical protein
MNSPYLAAHLGDESNLKKLIAKSYNFVIFVNEHRSNYQSLEDYIQDEIHSGRLDNDEINQEILKTMKENDRMVMIQIYPTTPVGFFRIYHHDIDLAIEQALKGLEE